MFEQQHYLKQQKEQALVTIELLRPFYEKKMQEEHPLIIHRATYEAEGVDGEGLDVTIPLQMLVSDGQLCISARSKAGLLGFYDIAPGCSKRLRVEYLFRKQRHLTMIDDHQQLLVPQKGHLI